MNAHRFEQFDDSNQNITNRILEKWETEPQFTDLKVGQYHLVIWRHPEFGQLNGYVGVKRGHPCFGKGMNHKLVSNLSVHWGITFAEDRIGDGFKKGYWYLGFDTAHAFDYPPYLQATLKEMEENDDPYIKRLNEMMKPFSNLVTIKPTKNFYKDISFLSEEIESLYVQLQEIEKRHPDFRHSHKKEYKEKHRLKQLRKKKTL